VQAPSAKCDFFASREKHQGIPYACAPSCQAGTMDIGLVYTDPTSMAP
jgi:hypothetical protein